MAGKGNLCISKRLAALGVLEGVDSVGNKGSFWLISEAVEDEKHRKMAWLSGSLYSFQALFL